VEAHRRRWAIRIVGLPAPLIKPESSDTAKELVVQFLRERLSIQSVEVTDIDCAHRFGAVKNEKQQILTRFFRRDLADHAIRNKKMLKGTGLAVFEDSPQLSRDLMIELKGQPEVESTWYLGGQVWAKLKNGPKKYKFSINDNVSRKVQKLYNKHAPTPSLNMPTIPQVQTETPACATANQTPVNTAQTSSGATANHIPVITAQTPPGATAIQIPVTTDKTPPLTQDEDTRPVPPFRHRRPTATA
jgi:hypothetical protein